MNYIIIRLVLKEKDSHKAIKRYVITDHFDYYNTLYAIVSRLSGRCVYVIDVIMCENYEMFETEIERLNSKNYKKLDWRLIYG